MIEAIIYCAIGFLSAALIGLLVIPLVHGRAVRLTMRRLEAAIPQSLAEVNADKDLLRAEFAMSTRRLEINIEQLKTKSASQLVELGKKGDAINQLKIELDALRKQLHTTEGEFAVKTTALQEAEHALSDKELELAKLKNILDERSEPADSQKVELDALRTQLHIVEEKYAENTTALHDAERALSDKKSELTKLTSELDVRSTLAEAQKIEIIALTNQVETLKEQLDGASDELKAVEDSRDTERIKFKATTEKLREERGKFENFHRSVAELVKQLMAQPTKDKILIDLEDRLVEQSRLLNENESELSYLRREIEIVRKAEADLRFAIIEADGRAHAATQNHMAEKAKLQSALDRANGERARLAHELIKMERQTKETRAA